MKLGDYPPQEPLSALGSAYQDRVLARGAGIEGRELAYGDDRYQRLIVYPATAGAGDVLVFFHGGGWTSGYKEWMAFMAPPLQARGITFVTAGYRLAPGHLFPSGFDDAADAVAWVHAHAARHGADPARIFVGGHSAGGHYAALLATTADWRRARGLAIDVVRGCLPVSGVYRFDAESGLSLRPRFLGPRSDIDAAAAASPLLRLDASACAPFLVAWGERDFAHLAAQGRQMHDGLRNAGIASETFVFDGCDHFEASLACGQSESGWPERAAAWMRAIPTPNHRPHEEAP
jgi:acetyl esterase/lipase